MAETVSAAAAVSVDLSPYVNLDRASLAEPGAAADLRLSCAGTGTATKSQTLTTDTEDSKGNSRTSTTSFDENRPFGGEATVEIVNGTGRIRLPRVFLPDVHGGQDGWFELRDLVVGDESIEAKAALSIFDHPNVRIDRRTGSITIDGNVGDFAGTCQPIDQSRRQRAF